MNQLIPASNTVTMSSLEIVRLINDSRDEDKAVLLHKNFLAKVPEVLGAEHSAKFLAQYKDSTGRSLPCYRMPKREACLMAMSYSYELQAIVFDRMTQLEQQPQFNIPKTLPDALRLAADLSEQVQKQQEQLAIAAPKAAFVDQYVEASGSMSFRQVAKLLNANERTFRQMLLDKGVMYYLGGVMTPYSQHQDAARFEVKTGTSETNGHAFSQARFTAKGVQWIAGIWAAYQLEVAA